MRFKQVQNINKSSCFVDFRNGWQIISPSKSFSVYAASSTEKSEWMAHINRCVQDLLTKRNYLSLPVSSLSWLCLCSGKLSVNCFI